ncbi:hypothetical protein CBF23_012050 [Marinomonas agarivorans]|nr:hypothetical protein CBF23_012050 [Marinomonas agarivorans]
MSQSVNLTHQAVEILRKNDMGGYTVPTLGLYPFQWNWDAGITALGWLSIDENRAWVELEKLFEGQWENGMVPHVIFHQESDDYFPGPEQWGVNRALPTTSISQPPLLATVMKILYEEGKDRQLAQNKLELLFPKLLAYHRWWYKERDLHSTGLVSSFHPWESGMDNSAAWDEALARVPQTEQAYERRDLNHVDSDQRPLKEQYDRYIYLVNFFKENAFDYELIFNHCPYHTQDISLNAILQRGTIDLVALNQKLSQPYDLPDLEVEIERTRQAIASLWHEEKGLFLNRDQHSGQAIDFATTAGMLPLYGRSVSAEQASKMAIVIAEWLEAGKYGLASVHPASEKFDAKRYWRGPSWLHINWMIADGLHFYGHDELAERLRIRSREIIETAGYWEYFDPITGEGCGGPDFSWTAAIALYWFL